MRSRASEYRWSVSTVVVLFVSSCGPSEAQEDVSRHDATTDIVIVHADGEAMDAPTPRACADGSFLSYENFGAPFFASYCNGCHSSRLVGDQARRFALADVDFDTLAGIRRWSRRIYARSADSNNTMPPLSGPSMEQRRLLGDWLACGAPGEELTPPPLEPFDASVRLDGACAAPTPPVQRMPGAPPACNAQIAACIAACSDRTGGCQVACSAMTPSCNSCYNQQKAVCLDRVCAVTFAVDRCCRATCAQQGEDAGLCIVRNCVGDGVAFLYCVQARGEECLGVDGTETRLCF